MGNIGSTLIPNIREIFSTDSWFTYKFRLSWITEAFNRYTIVLQMKVLWDPVSLKTLNCILQSLVFIYAVEVGNIIGSFIDHCIDSIKTALSNVACASVGSVLDSWQEICELTLELPSSQFYFSKICSSYIIIAGYLKCIDF